MKLFEVQSESKPWQNHYNNSWFYFYRTELQLSNFICFLIIGWVVFSHVLFIIIWLIRGFIVLQKCVRNHTIVVQLEIDALVLVSIFQFLEVFRRRLFLFFALLLVLFRFIVSVNLLPWLVTAEICHHIFVRNRERAFNLRLHSQTYPIQNFYLFIC